MEQYSKHAASLRELSSSPLASHVLYTRRDLCRFLGGSSLALERPTQLVVLEIAPFKRHTTMVALQSSLGDPKDTMWSQRCFWVVDSSIEPGR